MATPEELAELLQYGQQTSQLGMANAQAPRHWAQALAGALQMGIGGQAQRSAAQQEGQGRAEGDRMLADLLMGKGDASAAMANPYAAKDARAWQAGAPQREFQQFKMAQAKQMAPLDMEYRRAQIEAARASAAQRQAIAGSLPKLQQLGIDPNSAEGIVFQLTGKLPAKAYEKMAQDAKLGQTSANIAAGLRDVQEKAERANKAGSLETAIGPYQGAEPNSLVTAIPINIARGWGEVLNFLGGGKMSPTQVRSNITGSTEAIAAAIKPLIRGPGEGVWTDADQARLVSIVGDLAQARDLKEFKERLNDVRDRVQANFGLEIPFDANQAAAPAQPAAPTTARQAQGTFTLPDGRKVRRGADGQWEFVD